MLLETMSKDTISARELVDYLLIAAFGGYYEL